MIILTRDPTMVHCLVGHLETLGQRMAKDYAGGLVIFRRAVPPSIYSRE